jgi:hypothetical protein
MGVVDYSRFSGSILCLQFAYRPFLRNYLGEAREKKRLELAGQII